MEVVLNLNEHLAIRMNYVGTNDCFAIYLPGGTTSRLQVTSRASVDGLYEHKP